MGKRFLLQGGDCAERFKDCEARTIEAKIKILLQMALVLTYGSKIPVIKMGRMAGQYGKPRSSPFETLPDGTKIHSYKGDIINGFGQTEEERLPDPGRLLEAHFRSSSTLNYIRALIKGGFADIKKNDQWDLDKVIDHTKRRQYENMTNTILDSLEFLEACGVPTAKQLEDVDFFTCHEGLVLEYESATTKQVDNRHYNMSAHFLWIGNRTRALDGAHVEYFRGLANPIGIKVGTDMCQQPQQLVDLLNVLDPRREPGKITLITRLGKDNVKLLGPLIVAVTRAGLRPVWVCDPMHGNTYTSPDGIKTRNVDHILSELTDTIRVHQYNGSHLGGVHFELTGENVTECVGGPEDLQHSDLALRYTSYCDPRLNYLQGLEMSFLIANMLGKRAQTSHL